MDERNLLAAVAAAENLFFFSTDWLPLPTSEIDDYGDNVALPLLLTLRLKERKQRIPGYSEIWVNQYEEYDFFSHFRMSRKTYDVLVKNIAEMNLNSNKPVHFGGNKPVTIQKAVLVLLWYLAKGDTIISIADRFNLGISTTHGVIEKYLQDLVEMRHTFIKWPCKDEAALIANSFENISEYPGVIGAIDGTHFSCVVPEEQHDSYQNRKLQHSIIMQAVADSNKVLRDIFVGFPGSCNDGRVLRESPLYQKIILEGPQTLFYDDYHLVGDKAYVCYEWLMTPYRDTGRLTRQQKRHNFLLSKARVCVENVFGLLKGRWRILHYINVYNIKKVVKIVVACSVLHNICLINEDYFDSVIEDEVIDDFTNPARESSRGAGKRDEIMRHL